MSLDSAALKPITELEDVKRRIKRANEKLIIIIGDLQDKVSHISCLSNPITRNDETSASNYACQTSEFGKALEDDALVIEGQAARLQLLLENLCC